MSIYALIDPRTEKVRYVGRSINPTARLGAHLGNSQIPNAKSKRMMAWLAELAAADAAPVMKVVAEEGTEAEWIERLQPDINTMAGAGADPWIPRPRPRTKTLLMPVFRVSEEQDKEIRRRANEARMTLAEYMRERCLGKPCRPAAEKGKKP